jgi:ABC-2 type transport system ATP-binding protein
LRELKAKGITIVLVTHDTNTVASFCDKAIWLNEGVIQASGKSKLVVDQYLEFMNKELFESMQAQEQSKRDAEESEPEKSETDQPLSDEEEIDYKANRFGLRFVEITRAGFINAAGDTTHIVRHGEKAELRICYKVNKPLNRYIFGIGIYTLDLVCIYGVNTELDGHVITELPKEGYVSFMMDDVMLLTGKYILQVAIVDGNGTPMDYYRNYCYFDVISKVKAIGTNEMRHIWRINGGNE